MLTRLASAMGIALWAAAAGAEDVRWPDLANPKSVGGGERDAAVIAAVERYVFVAPVPGARANGEAWFEYLTEGRKVPVDAVTLLRDQKVTVESLRKAVRKAARRVERGGTLWFVFIGHGAAAKDGRDGVLVGADAQQEPDSLYARSVGQSELLGTLEKGGAARVVAVIDACFSGRTPGGKPLVEGLQPLVVQREEPAPSEKSVVLTAAKADEFAGPLPGLNRPALSYLVLGGLRGWADADGDGKVSAREATAYTAKALRALVQSRSQTPTVAGAADAVLGEGREAGPPLTKLVLKYGAGAEETATTPSRPPEVEARAPLVGTFAEEGRAFPGALGPNSPEVRTTGRRTCRFHANGIRCHYGTTYGSGPSAFVLVGTSESRWDPVLGSHRIAARNNLGTIEGAGQRVGSRVTWESGSADPHLRLRFSWDFGNPRELAFRMERSWQGGPWTASQEGISRPVTRPASPEIQALASQVGYFAGESRIIAGARGPGSPEVKGEMKRSCSFSEGGLACHYRTKYPSSKEVAGTWDLLPGVAPGMYRVSVRNNLGAFEMTGRREGNRLVLESVGRIANRFVMRATIEEGQPGEARYRSELSMVPSIWVPFEEAVLRRE